jgi:hypothetical protein
MPRVLDKFLVYPSGLRAALTMYVIGPETPINPIDEKINSFAFLRDGWDYGNGGPIPQHTRDLALAWNRFLQSQGFVESDAFPGGDGEIVIATESDDHYLEVIIESDDSISLAYDFQSKQVFYRANMSSMDAVQTIIELAGQICGVSGYYTQTNLIGNEVGLRAQRFGTQRRTDVFQSSVWNALTTEETQFAHTSGDSIRDIPESWESHRYFGSLNPIFYHHLTK